METVLADQFNPTLYCFRQQELLNSKKLSLSDITTKKLYNDAYHGQLVGTYIMFHPNGH